jgi:uncharacterized Ntn-hydrolase superfamily protein
VTYSIVARDPVTGEMGVAVQSHSFAVGSIVSWAEAGVGAVATQSFAEPAYGSRGLELMRRGTSAPEALHRLLAEDSREAVRQVAMLDSVGRVAVHTGGRCVRAAGHRIGQQVAAQANMMLRSTVWDAMLEAFGSASGDLAARLLAAMDAAEREGGDIRGRQSAAVVVVAGRASGRPLADTPVDLRVEDHPDPLGELRRLLELRRAYDRVERADELAAAGDLEAALDDYSAAQDAVPENIEMAFWRGVALACAGRVDEARPFLEPAFRAHDAWAELLRRLPAAGLLPDDRGLLESLLPPGR